ncbi:endolytic transglycosylase MltG [Sporosarcina siberiensis]|uniref:Endolytic murein transglycosylase n=1 Tax=Sporosarcina siberiensis TaxID=1365606 RepID=A0ABW4SDJ1_9BACL
MDNGSKKDVMFARMREKKKEVKIVRRIVFAIALILLIAGLLGGRTVYKYITEGLQPLDPESETVVEIEIPIGSGLDSISAKLEENGIIKDARLFKYYAKFNNESNFQAGTYKLTKAMTPDELIQSLKSGKVYREPVFTMTIPEGLNLKEIAAVVQKRAGIPEEDFMEYVTNESNIDLLISKYPSLLSEEIKGENVKFALEGYLFPATYPFYEEKPTLSTIVGVMLEATAANVVPHLAYLQEQEKSVHWLLTFASLVEKEATAQSDREVIASVFFNRMKLNPEMPLQTDPTVAYAHQRHLTTTLYKDLEIDDPYNTYVYKGLPPGPIANAGKVSIDAVLDPEQTNYLFFIAGKDGQPHYAIDYQEHLENIANYLD